MRIYSGINIFILGMILSSCGPKSSDIAAQEAELKDTVQKAQKGDKAAMRDLEKMVREKVKSDKKLIANSTGIEKLAKQFYWDQASGKIDDETLKKMAREDGNMHAQVYTARIKGFSSELTPADRKLFIGWLEHISTLDSAHMYYALNGKIYPLAGEAAFIISNDYLNARWLYYTDTTKSIAWLKTAAQNQHPEAMFKLAIRYQYGLDMDKDLDMAKTWMQKSADADWRQAAQELAKLKQ
ncbi:MAG: sel1 repeat family protein [Robiginitomaculum sp.]|nr:sel1 repeat family protein [Robiginitomaculum sp.]